MTLDLHPPFLTALLDPAAYPHPVDEVVLCETHISWVFLAGEYAYKVKKPVDLGFVDFTTRELRDAACQEELRLNRRLCQSVYLGVSKIVAEAGGFALDRPGDVVELAVRMRRLPADGMLDLRLRRGQVDAALFVRIGEILARFHALAETGPTVDRFGSPASVRAIWQENFEQTEAFPVPILPTAYRTGIRRYVERFLRERLPLLERRVRGGRVRDGHGDLHAGNICVDGEEIYLFDCLEFSARLRCADVAADLGFLAMDLEHVGRRDLADLLVESYRDASGDTELDQVLDFYRCYRAYVRGKVAGLRLEQTDLQPAQRERLESESKAYFDLAMTYVGE